MDTYPADLSPLVTDPDPIQLAEAAERDALSREAERRLIAERGGLPRLVPPKSWTCVHRGGCPRRGSAPGDFPTACSAAGRCVGAMQSP